MDGRFHKRRGDVERYHDSFDHYEHSYGSKNMCNEHNDSYSYGGYNCRISSQTLGTTSRPLNYNNFKLPLLGDTFCPYGYKALEQEVESLFYSYAVREEEKLQLVLKFLSYEVNVWWDRNFENIRRIELQLIKTWSLMKQTLRIKCGVVNHERQGQGQSKVKFIEFING
ncbi:hypothetical protein M9H77_23425 [Catharanthus roseus]|uniref:Uncharacterized protein n=1 Tax=Catharanthus roseus TaxID=4058 RepID=A0ACC0AUH8_CATRO|nr:hypothetical protein M9H77_23425 [Catharanthus roseus]